MKRKVYEDDEMTMQMKQIDNKNELLRDDLKTTIKKAAKFQLPQLIFQFMPSEN